MLVAVVVTVAAMLTLADPSPPSASSIVVAAIDKKDVDVGPGRPVAELALELEAQRPALSACANEAGKEQTIVATLYVKDDGTLSGIDGPKDQVKLTSCLRGTLTPFSSNKAKSQTVRVTLHAAKGALPARTAIAKSVVADIVRAHTSEIQTCYAGSADGAGGDLTLEWIVEPDGTLLGNAVLGAPPALLDVASCIQLRASSWAFPKPSARAVVRFPLHLSVPKKKT